jgi:hypothetical protein
MDIKDTAAEALEKGKDLGHEALDKAKEAGEKAKEMGGHAVDKLKEAAGEATKEGGFLDKLKDRAEELTHLDLNRDGKIGDKPRE